MNTTTTTTSHGSGNVIAFLFGAIFNILANVEYGSLTDYAVKAMVGGFIWLLFKILGDAINKHFFKEKKDKTRKKANGKK